MYVESSHLYMLWVHTMVAIGTYLQCYNEQYVAQVDVCVCREGASGTYMIVCFYASSC